MSFSTGAAIWLAIMGFVVLAFLVKKIILWIIDTKKLKKENWLLLEQMEIIWEKVKHGFEKAEITLAQIEKNYPESVWENHKRYLVSAELDELEYEVLIARRECQRSIFWAKEAQRTIRSLIFDLRQDQKAIDVINNLPDRILIAQATINKVLNEILPLIYEMDALAANDHLARGVKGYYEKIKADFWKLKEEFDSISAKLIDWLDFEVRFTKIFGAIKVAKDNPGKAILTE